MKKILSLLTLLVLFSCERNSQEPICLSQEMAIIDLEKKLDELFQENGRLKDQLLNCERFIKERDSTVFNID